jgi:hypothetical protein
VFLRDGREVTRSEYAARPARATAAEWAAAGEAALAGAAWDAAGDAEAAAAEWAGAGEAALAGAAWDAAGDAGAARAAGAAWGAPAAGLGRLGSTGVEPAEQGAVALPLTGLGGRDDRR